MIRHNFLFSSAFARSNVASTTTTTALLVCFPRYQGRRGGKAPSFSSKPEHTENPDLSRTNPYQGAKKGINKQPDDFETEQFNKYYSKNNHTASSSAPTTASSKINSKNNNNNNTSTTFEKSSIPTGESPFGLRRRRIEHVEMEDKNETPDIVRLHPLVRRREAQSHYHNTVPHGATFHNSAETPEPLYAPGTVANSCDDLPPPANFVRFLAFPKRYVFETIGWAPATVVTTGKYEEPPQVVAARIEATKRAWAKMQERDLYGGGNEWLGRAEGAKTTGAGGVGGVAEDDDEAARLKMKPVVDGETQVMGTVTSGDFVMKAGIHACFFFFASFGFVAIFMN
jgi:hypothetical protein